MPRTGRTTIAISVVLITLSLAGAQAALAETDVLKDVLRPHGIARGEAQRDADSRACGATSDRQSYGVPASELPAFERCMRAHGWAHAYTKPEAAERAIGGTVYDAMTGRSRGEAVLYADRRACSPPERLKEGNLQFARCMASHGWRLAFALPAPATPTYAGGPSRSSGSGRSHEIAEETYWEAQHWADQQNDWARQESINQESNAAAAATSAAAAAAAAASAGNP